MKLVRKNSRILSQHSHFRSLKDKTRCLRAIRVTWSRFTRQWILPLLFHHYFFVPKRRGGCDSLSCHSIIATGVDWPSIGVTFDVWQITLQKHTFIYMISVGGWSIACRVGGSCLVSSKRPKTLQGGVESWERELKPHWLRNGVGGASRLGVFNALFHCCWVFSSWFSPGGRVSTVRGQPLHNLCLFTKMSFSCTHSLDGSFPPSPVEDRGSKRLSWGSLLQRLTELKGISQRVTDHKCSRSETGGYFRKLHCFFVVVVVWVDSHCN